MLFVFLVWVSLLGITKFCLRLRQDLLFFQDPLGVCHETLRFFADRTPGTKKRPELKRGLRGQSLQKALVAFGLVCPLPFLS